MKRVYVIGLIGSVALVGLVLWAGLAGAAASAPAPAAAPAPAPAAAATDAKAGEAPMKACPMCPMMAGKGMDMGKGMGMGKGKGMGMGKGMDMPPAMKQRCQMMINAEMSKDDAACLLASTQELKLTPEQVQKLDQIVKQSRQEAAAILTPEQKKTLAEVPEKPASMCEMHTKMHEMKMQKMDAGPKTTEEKAKKGPEGAASPKK